MKSIIKLVPITAVLFMGMLSCDKEDEKQSGPKIETLNADKGTFKVATLSGRVIGLEDVALDFECGIEYSTDESLSDEYSTRQKIDKKYSENSYSITITDIKPGKKYYYRAYYINQQMIYYGEVKTFTFEWTAPAVTTLSAELNESGAVVLKGLVKDKGTFVEELSEYYPYGYYGIEISTTDAFDNDSTTSLYPDRNTDSMNNDSVICIMTQFKYGTTYYYRTFFRMGEIQSLGQVKSFIFEWRPRMVDLGLSVKWASCNVGATYPWDYGDYFAWGETDPKLIYNWSTYKHCNGLRDTFTKYCSSRNNGNNGFTDAKTTLDPIDDAAHVNWGGNWRMPTKSELDELCNTDNCTWTWTTKNDVNGYLVTSKKTGYEGATIFLPAAGFLVEGSAYDFINDTGYYWSNSLNRDATAWYLFCGSDGYNHTLYDNERICGFPVRPVCP